MAAGFSAAGRPAAFKLARIVHTQQGLLPCFPRVGASLADARERQQTVVRQTGLRQAKPLQAASLTGNGCEICRLEPCLAGDSHDPPRDTPAFKQPRPVVPIRCAIMSRPEHSCASRLRREKTQRGDVPSQLCRFPARETVMRFPPSDAQVCSGRNTLVHRDPDGKRR